MASPAVANAYTLQRDVSLDVTSVAAGKIQEESFTVTGLKTSQVVVVNKHGDDDGLFLVGARVTADDTLALTFWNPSAAAIDPASQTFKVVAL